eukprot:scaffold14701_cov173-Ochromonas_danica.AAC.2
MSVVVRGGAAGEVVNLTRKGCVLPWKKPKKTNHSAEALNTIELYSAITHSRSCPIQAGRQSMG